MQRSCDSCGRSYEAKRATSRYCSAKCRTRASRSAKSGAAVGQVVPLAPASGLGDLEQATLEELAAVGRDRTAIGKAALKLARSIDNAPAESGTSEAARFREWQAMLTRAKAGTGVEKSPLDKMRDELAARRARRGA